MSTIYKLVNGNAILDIKLTSSKKYMMVEFSDPNVYDERSFPVHRNPDNPNELLQDIIDQFGFADNPQFRATGWELSSKTEVTLVKEVLPNDPTRRLAYGVITDYPHSVKFTAILLDMNGVAVKEAPEIIFLKPTHPAYDMRRVSKGKFAKLASWLADKKIDYDTVTLGHYADKILYLVEK